MKNPERLGFSINLGSSDLKIYEKQKKLGSGSFGVVYKVIKKETNEAYVVKVSIYEMDQCSEDTIMNLLREIDIISMMNHISVLNFIGYSPNNFKGIPKPVIITEYSSNGSLDIIIELERNGLSHPDWDDTKNS